MLNDIIELEINNCWDELSKLDLSLMLATDRDINNLTGNQRIKLRGLRDE